MNASFFSRKPLMFWLLVFLGAGLFWFFVMMHPWLAFFNSDGAVPFQLVVEPWIPQDLFYWQTSRMGMLYEIFYKAVVSLLGIRESWAGSELYPELFYLGHVLVVFAGFAFWLETLPTRLGKVLFLAFFLPLTHLTFEYYLTPGQPYGVVFALNGAFYWTLLKARDSARKQVALGLLLGAMFIQHELAFLILVAVYVSRSVPRAREVFRPRHLLMGTVLGICMAIGFYFKARSREWDPSAHYRLTDVQSFIALLWESIREGRWTYAVRRGTGHIVTIAVVVYLVDLVRSQRQRFFLRSVEETTFIGVIIAFMLVHLARWYAINGKDPRYFSNLTPLLIWVFIRKIETLAPLKMRPAQIKRWLFLAACIVPLWTQQSYDQWINPFIRARLQVPTGEGIDYSKTSVQDCPNDLIEKSASPELRDSLLFKISPSWAAETCRLLNREHVLALSQAVLASSCAGYVDDYWNSHILVTGSSGQVHASAGNHIRNPVMFDRILHSRPLCVMPRNTYAFQKYVSGLDCKGTPQGFLVCRDPHP